MSSTEPRYCFLVDWFDIHAQLTREYEFFFYPSDSTIEMYDSKQRRTFLKRTKYSLRLQDLFLGAAINVHSRQLTIRDYGDDYSRGKLLNQMESTLLLIKPDGYAAIGKIIDSSIQRQFSICRMRMLNVTPNLAQTLLEKDPASHAMIDSFIGGHSLAIELLKPNAVQELIDFAGPLLVEDANREDPKCIRAQFGSSGYKNAVHVPSSYEEAKRQLDIIFGSSSSSITRTATFRNCSLAIIKPHAIVQGQSGVLISMIQAAGFSITDMELYHLDRSNAEDFLEVYKGVVPEYHLMVDQLTAGPLIAIEISGNEDITTVFREFAGPTDPELAKQVRPSSIRAKFGVDKVCNAVHCTDLPEDGVLESQFFFRIMSS
ncbi:hypothetical protein BASA50_004733 [Batrachochytrium salamandrivorans]|uniref:Nucleoside diphosphate kinase n=1 Tax=Batrachochytrium salamandrivorans TaxID=1357716 RepID=A0ABQ8FEJ9_9FUNG|nr:hypothetical protein BASA62_009462 [Batrachochytrium salamandrivorans]KAH6590747.1 hypothetical protein BASA61_005168 [Batrachochytrium salamandrivorans]KAH6596975.1 hypothetical protein BASA50_004733 [Batrachochytrium salamandrivorans]KAH9273482.1 hypothetical protein BASA83_004148 [Batrachochytrium salamandrivorans]